jgi:hypothetical protein
MVLCIAIGTAGAEPAHARPEIYVTIASASDHTPGAHPSERVRNADTIKRVLLLALARTPSFRARWQIFAGSGLDVRKIDIEVVQLRVDRTRDDIEVTAQLRLVVCDERGRMLSILSGGASARRPARVVRAEQLVELRRDALEGAVQGMFAPLRTHLLRPAV